ncbi:hypothetical protein GCM10010282_01280 [Streptomyces roseolus]|nr:hypothetical protein GCM10010282_01280 [Streptomyces roseolus]
MNGDFTCMPDVIGEPTLPKATGTPTSYALITYVMLTITEKTPATSAPAAPSFQPVESCDRPTNQSTTAAMTSKMAMTNTGVPPESYGLM